MRLLSCEKKGLPSRLSEIVHHPLSPFTKRAFYAIVVLAIVMAVGTVGLMVNRRTGSSRIFLLHGAARYRGGASRHSSDRCREDICRYNGLLLDRSRDLSHNFHVRPIVRVSAQGRGALF